MSGSQPAPGTRSHALQAQLLSLEKQLKTAMQDSEPMQPPLVQLRNELRDRYEELLFLDYDYACEVDVETRLWKNAFYRQIEEFRKLIRKRSASGHGVDAAIRAFRGFLAIASGFYMALLARASIFFAIDGVLVDLPQLGLDGAIARRPNPLQATQPGLDMCHRCLVYLGDIARYAEQQADGDRSYRASRHSYEQALRLMPDNGAPHNQLAVLCTYGGDYPGAAYHYARSIMTARPSINAADNLARVLDDIHAALGQPNFAGNKQLLRLTLALCTPGLAGDSEECVQLLAGLYATPKQAAQLPPPTALRIATLSIFAVQHATADGQPSDVVDRILHRHLAVLAALLDASIALAFTDAFRSVFSAVKILCDWLRARVQLWRHLGAAHRVWRRLVDMLNSPVLSAATKEEDMTSWAQQVPLPEDRELRGLLPLRDASHLTVVRTALAAPISLTLTEEHRLRARCVVAFGRWLAQSSAVHEITRLIDVVEHPSGPVFSVPSARVDPPDTTSLFLASGPGSAWAYQPSGPPTVSASPFSPAKAVGLLPPGPPPGLSSPARLPASVAAAASPITAPPVGSSVAGAALAAASPVRSTSAGAGPAAMATSEDEYDDEVVLFDGQAQDREADWSEDPLGMATPVPPEENASTSAPADQWQTGMDVWGQPSDAMSAWSSYDMAAPAITAQTWAPPVRPEALFAPHTANPFMQRPQ
eukprot:m.104247 g.104247  ORF g.104247 m.104247 type:complete len:706 (+) comp8879_c1_seq2:206-2323(+)